MWHHWHRQSLEVTLAGEAGLEAALGRVVNMGISRAGLALLSWLSSQEVDSGWHSVGHGPAGYREIDGQSGH